MTTMDTWMITKDGISKPEMTISIPEGHGTTVSGTIGAVGNNNLFATGVNWNVKIMHVDFNQVSEANSLAAYTYPWVMRKRYNETGGTEGAFVVATNASWGIDFGDPASAPLWCAIYDSLGQAGILNCGATANLNINIDVQGDLPTACPSEYMVAVTATNDNDIRTFSGYGIEQIDVGAPGEDVIQINLNGGPTSTSGTSFASPTVAGLIGLLYASPCSSIGPLAISNPEETALLVRDAIFAGVDPIPSLQSEIKYGGRVNAWNSMQILLQNCGPCPAPYGLAVTGFDDVTADLLWSSTDSTLSTNIRWRVLGNPNWNDVENVSSPFTLNGLEACTQYEVQLEDVCADTTSGYSLPLLFKTDGCCEAPKGISVANISETGADISWDFVLAANSFNLLLSSQSGSQLIEGINETSTSLSLEPCTLYEVQVQTVCDTGLTDFGTLIEFTTFGCGTCTDFTYCSSQAGNASQEWIENVTINTLNNSSGSDEGYGDYTGLTTDLETYKFYDIFLTPGFNNYPFDERFAVWVDFNHNGQFDEPEEKVFDPGTTTQSTLAGTVVVPGDAIPGITRMRVMMRFSVEPIVCEPIFNFGEVEDYCINIVPGTPPDCQVPSGFDVSNVSFTTADLSWNQVTDAHGYEIRIKPTSEPTWQVIVNNLSFLSLPNLLTCTEYEYQVRAECVGVMSDWS